MRQHVNPLSQFFQLPLELPSSSDLFQDEGLPIHLDIGSARGRFLLALASLHPNWNYLGVEIRQSLVNAANREKQQLGLDNLCFLFCNANVSLESWLMQLSKDQLQRVSIQFPDPWFKRRHHKRRVLQPSLLLAIASAMQPGREVFIQSDLLSVIQPMAQVVEISCCFDRSPGSCDEWLSESPFNVSTEREKYALAKGLDIFRVIYRRNHNPLPELPSFVEAHKKLTRFGG